MRFDFLKKIKASCHPFRVIESIMKSQFEKQMDEIKLDSQREIHSLMCFQKKEALTYLALNTTSKGITQTPFIDNRQVIVSLTSHGKRLYEVFLAIESIMQGSWRPNKIVLWLDEKSLDEDLPDMLKRQQDRGLEIYYTRDLGPHTKLIPALKAFPEDVIITIDDDMFYQYDMVENLVKAHRKDPHAIWANRVTVMTVENQKLNSYLDWIHYAHPNKDSSRSLITGVEGCLYPPHALAEEVFNEAVFQRICHLADDVWFTAMALLKGTPVKHLYTHYENGCAGAIENRDVQDVGLFNLNDNKSNCLNDLQIKAVFEHYHLYEYIL